MGRYNYCAVEIMAVWARLGRDYDDTGTDDDDRDGGCGGIDGGGGGGGGGFWIVSLALFDLVASRAREMARRRRFHWR